MKRHVADQNLFAKSPIQMLEFVKIVRATQFYHRPDYEKLFNLLNDAMKSAKYKWSDPYHWEPEKRKKKPSVPAVGNVPRKGNILFFNSYSCNSFQASHHHQMRKLIFSPSMTSTQTRSDSRTSRSYE